MNNEIIELRRKNLYSKDLFFLLSSGCVSRNRLISCVQSLGIVFPGVRIKNLSEQNIAEALTNDFYKRNDVTKAVAELLDEYISQLDLPVPETYDQIKKFKKRLKSLTPEKTFAYSWKLSGLQSDAALECLKKLHYFVDRQIHRAEGGIADEVMDDLMKLPSKLSSTEDALDDSQRRLHKQEKRIRELEEEKKEVLMKFHKSEETAQSDMHRIKSLEKQIEYLRQEHNELLKPSEEIKEKLKNTEEEIRFLQGELKITKDKLSSWRHLKRVGLFVDVQNLIISAKQEYHGQLNFESLWNKVEHGGPESSSRIITEAYAYVAEDSGQKKNSLKSSMEKAGFSVRTRPIMYRSNGTAKGDWDLGMTIEILDRVDRLDIVVLGTGDGDFLDLVEYLKKNKSFLCVEIVCIRSPHQTSERLLKAVDYVHYLESHDIIKYADPEFA